MHIIPKILHCGIMEYSESILKHTVKCVHDTGFKTCVCAHIWQSICLKASVFWEQHSSTCFLCLILTVYFCPEVLWEWGWRAPTHASVGQLVSDFFSEVNKSRYIDELTQWTDMKSENSFKLAGVLASHSLLSVYTAFIVNSTSVIFPLGSIFTPFLCQDAQCVYCVNNSVHFNYIVII